MINLLVDEAYAFDYLAILYIKSQKNNNDIIQQNYNTCSKIIQEQVGNKLYNKIICSEEYKNMINVNLKVFDAVEKARYSDITAREVDKYNMDRFNAKLELQDKFFPKINLTEWKS